MRIFLATLSILLAGAGAARAEWTQFRQLPLNEVPITLALKGWEDGSWRTIAYAREFTPMPGTDCISSHVYTNFKKDAYSGTIGFRDTRHDCTFPETTVRAMVESTGRLKETKIDYGATGRVDNGPAEYSYLMFTSEGPAGRMECVGFRSTWRSFYSTGYLCASNRPLGEVAAKSFLRALEYKNTLSPVAGSLE